MVLSFSGVHNRFSSLKSPVNSNELGLWHRSEGYRWRPCCLCLGLSLHRQHLFVYFNRVFQVGSEDVGKWTSYCRQDRGCRSSAPQLLPKNGSNILFNPLTNANSLFLSLSLSLAFGTGTVCKRVQVATCHHRATKLGWWHLVLQLVFSLNSGAQINFLKSPTVKSWFRWGNDMGASVLNWPLPHSHLQAAT